MKLCEIITVGDELLIGQVVDTNSAWIAQRLNQIGVRVSQITSISDSENHILSTLDEASKRADIILMTGGLGPTKDDITKKTFAKYFGSALKTDDRSLEIINEIFKSRGREVTDINRGQAEVPDNCTVLLNRWGTAPGMWFEKNNTIYISLPGVPGEMKGLLEDEVVPRLTTHFSLVPILHKTVLTQGIGESFLSEMIAKWEDDLPPHLRLAYLPSTGLVRLRLSGHGSDEKELRRELQNQIDKIIPVIKDYVYGYDHDTLESVLGNELRKSKKTVCTAESCTGGYIAHRITGVPGSSEYYMGSIVAYSNDVKVNELNVPMNVIEKYGAVSEEVVRIMAESAFKKFKTDYCISASGIAGPDGGSVLKPVGTVWVAISDKTNTITRKLQLGNHRDRVIVETANHALNLLRKMITGEIST